jgi:hypothetical protein
MDVGHPTKIKKNWKQMGIFTKEIGNTYQNHRPTTTIEL